MIILDYKDRRAIYEQVVEKFQELMLCGILEKDSQLPSVRSMAMDLSINPNTIQRAYAELERQGFIYSVKGKGSFVAENCGIKEAKGLYLYKEIETLTEEAIQLGMKKEELIQRIEQIYNRGGKQDDRSKESDKTI
ncbi:MAG: GntR family transcriptional regulator [Hungatella sp.]